MAEPRSTRDGPAQVRDDQAFPPRGKQGSQAGATSAVGRSGWCSTVTGGDSLLLLMLLIANGS